MTIPIQRQVKIPAILRLPTELLDLIFTFAKQTRSEHPPEYNESSPSIWTAGSHAEYEARLLSFKLQRHRSEVGKIANLRFKYPLSCLASTCNAFQPIAERLNYFTIDLTKIYFSRGDILRLGNIPAHCMPYIRHIKCRVGFDGSDRITFQRKAPSFSGWFRPTMVSLFTLGPVFDEMHKLEALADRYDSHSSARSELELHLTLCIDDAPAPANWDEQVYRACGGYGHSYSTLEQLQREFRHILIRPFEFVGLSASQISHLKEEKMEMGRLRAEKQRAWLERVESGDWKPYWEVEEDYMSDVEFKGWLERRQGTMRREEFP
ncbi:hypothetical protein BJ508DRAFT_320362 [Ascobolus immersus RN42]|uniref:Uncharacterized protein n=1 Tax=Ascobolus immersus RN42 TaxID=1160509 RepID=A0A3N4IQ36_ASCIM|nr:hypothetical protein BJ508DRAFT_320362 [Ascobolus immersus RN42]